MGIDFRDSGLSDGEVALASRLYGNLERFAVRNALRGAYYDHERTVRGLGLEDVSARSAMAMVLGWCPKGVDAMSERTVCQGLVVPGVDLAETGLDVVWRDNRLEVESTQVQTSALISSVAFIITMRGDVSRGEPDVLVLPKDASTGTGDWDPRARRLANFLSVTAVDERARPVEVVLYLPGEVVTVVQDGSRLVVADRSSTGIDYVPVEPLVYRGRTGRPFGSSRISRTAMEIQDAGLRTLVRSEIAAHEHINPVRALLNADLEQFMNEDGTPNAAYLAFQRSKTIALPPTLVDVGGDTDQLANQSFQMIQGLDMGPHMDHLEMWAGQFSAETSVPMNELGIRSQSQPVSAEAILAANDSLIRKVGHAIRDFTPAWSRTAQTAYRLLHDVQELPPEVARVTAKYLDPRFASQAAMSDATVKEVQAGILPAESEVTLERLGYSQTDVKRVQADRAKKSAQTTLQAAIAAGQTGLV